MPLMQEKLSTIFTLCARINLETDLCCFFDMSGHVDLIKISVRESKDNFEQSIHGGEIYYRRNKYSFKSEEKFFNEAVEECDLMIADLQNILSRKWGCKYTVYVNLFDTSFNEVFSSEKAAKKWKRKMEEKYDKVGAIVGIKRETSGQLAQQNKE